MPIQVVGSGVDLNAATANGLERAAKLLDTSVDEVKNRVTITGAVEIGRAPGLVTVSLLARAQATGGAGHRPSGEGAVRLVSGEM